MVTLFGQSVFSGSMFFEGPAYSTVNGVEMHFFDGSVDHRISTCSPITRPAMTRTNMSNGTTSVADDETLWYRGASPSLISHVKQRRANVNLIRLALLERQLKMSRPECPVVKAFLEQRQWWALQPPLLAAEVLASPWCDHWAYLADCCRQRLEHGEPVTFNDLPSYQHFGGGDAKAIEWFLQDFDRFTVELALLVGIPASGQVMTWEGRVHLGFWGAVIQVEVEGLVPWHVTAKQSGTALRVGSVEVLREVSATELQLVQGTSALINAPRIVRPGVPGIYLSDHDPLVQREWVKVYKNPDGSSYLPAPSDLGPFLMHYDAGLELIERHFPQLGRDIALGLHTIIPVGKPAADRGGSCTSDTFFGGILCCDNPPVLAAEVLIHEFGHNVFNELLARDGVFATGLSGEEVLYSPWREDPRPILGLFHAAFVFERVSQFYARYTVAHPEDLDAAFRFRLLLACTRIACRSLATANAYQSFGCDLLDGMTMRTNALARLPHAVLQHEERSAIEQHFRDWCARNPLLAVRNQFKMPD